MKFTSVAVALLSITGALAKPLAEPQIQASELEERQVWQPKFFTIRSSTY